MIHEALIIYRLMVARAPRWSLTRKINIYVIDARTYMLMLVVIDPLVRIRNQNIHFIKLKKHPQEHKMI